MKAAGFTAAVFAAALAVGACGDDTDTAATDDTTETSAPAGTMGTTDTADAGGGETGNAIVIEDFKFQPETLKAKVGDKIMVTNSDSAPHTATAKDDSFDTETLEAGASGTITLAKAGTIDYVCNIHDYMSGTIEVE